MRACGSCGVVKQLAEFAPDRRRKEGRGLHCLSCRNLKRQNVAQQATRRWRERNPDYGKRYYANNPRVQLKNQERWYRRYGLTLKGYDRILVQQGGVCATCGAEPGSKRANGKRLSVDHDHTCCPAKKSCGECVRGLICDSCNIALGRVQDDIQILLRMVAYLSPDAKTTLPTSYDGEKGNQ